MSTTDRGNMIIRLAELVEENKEVLATLETWDNGMCTSSKYEFRF